MTLWVWIHCSVCGNLQAQTKWDVGLINIVVADHYARKHLGLGAD